MIPKGSRLAGLALCACLVVGLAQCKQKPGDKCSTPGKYTCVDTASALLCSSGTVVTLPCRGPHGCQGKGAASQCDDDLALEGDICQTTLNEDWSCSTDHKRELLCKDGKFQVARACKGPKSCQIQGNEIDCDDSMADVGDVCIEEPGDANYGCSLDKQTEVVCKSGKFQASNSCRGLKGCSIDGNTVSCDQSIAHEGELCRPVDNYSCSADAKVMLTCSPTMKWIKAKDCKKSGCRVKGHEVSCD